MKNRKLIVIASFIGLWLTSFLSNDRQFFLGFILILSFGIVHGANDLLISKKNNTDTNYSVIKFYVQYLLIIVIVISVFYIIPFFTLLCFIIISGYHFGEQHWNELFYEKKVVLKKTFYILYGLTILLLLFYFNDLEVASLIYTITSTSIKISYIEYLLFIILSAFITICTYLFKTNSTFKKVVLEELFYILVLAILFKVSSLIWGFAIYFIIWHSIPSMYDQIKFLYGNYTISNLFNYLKDSVIYWFVSIFSLAIFYYFYNGEKLFEVIFFSFLVAITFPHVYVISKMFRK